MASLISTMFVESPSHSIWLPFPSKYAPPVRTLAQSLSHVHMGMSGTVAASQRLSSPFSRCLLSLKDYAAQSPGGKPTVQLVTSTDHSFDPEIPLLSEKYTFSQSSESLQNAKHDRHPRTRGAFRPQKAGKGTSNWQLRQFAEATLGSGSLRKAVKLPEGEDINEWLAVNGN